MRAFLSITGFLWGLAGMLSLLGFALYRLTPLAIDALHYSLTTVQWLVLAANCVFMAWSEGYRGFQQSFSPRVAARLRWLCRHPCPLLVGVAPLFCLGLIHAPPKRKLTFVILTSTIVVLIVLIRLLDQPWRGVLDAGVVVGLSWGTLSLLWCVLQAFTCEEYSPSPELPQKSSQVYEHYCARRPEQR